MPANASFDDKRHFPQGMHVAVAIVLCLLVPGAGWLFGDPELAWSMYAKSSSFRLRVEGTSEGRRRSVPASALAAAATGSLRTALGGAEQFKFTSSGPSVRRSLAKLTLLACEVSGAERVRLTLEERATLDAPPRTTRKEATCPTFGGSAWPARQSAR
ncbi:MAG TPA: hypothetical protein VFK05_12755 [Polyangiaceae bacterium]|nr:hypothetical protein [Polyangiaceae bacterium]